MANINSMNVGGQLSMIEDTAAREMEANAYDPTQTYAKEDICIYNDKLYEANTAIATPEAFNIAHWTETTLGKIAQKHRDSISQLTKKREWTKVSFVGAVDVKLSIPSNKCARVPSTAEEICVEITAKRNASTTIKFSQYLKTPGTYNGGYYNSDKYYASYQIGYSNNIIYLDKSWLKVVDNGIEYNNVDTANVDVYYR